MMIARQVSFADVATLELSQQHEADEAGINTLRIRVRSLEELQSVHPIRAWTAWLEDGQAPDFLEMP